MELLSVEYMEQDESRYLEYKSSGFKLSDSLFETYSAFANTSGGIIVLGVEEEEDFKGLKRYRIAGVQNPQQQEEQLVARLKDTNLTTYNTMEDVRIRTTIGGKKILELIVNEAPLHKKPVEVQVTERNKSKKMKAFIRQGTADVEAKGELYQALVRNQIDDADSDVIRNLSLESLDMECVHYYRDLMIKKNQEEDKQNFLQDLTDEEFLIRQRVAVLDRETNDLHLTAGGLLFFGLPHAILSQFPHFQLDLYDKRSEERWQHRISTVVDDLNVFQFFNRCHEYLQVTAQNKFQLDENRMRIDGLSALRDALREALVNFCMHTDFFTETPSSINIYWDYYDFKNTGMMKVPVENFFTTNDSRYRNTVISKLFVNIGYGERGGTGGGIIYNVAKNGTLRYPEITSEVGVTELRVWTVDFIKSVSDLPEELKQVFAIISKSSVALGRKSIMEITGLSQYKINSILLQLTELSYIEKTGSGPSTKYQKLLTPVQEIANIKQLAADLKFPYKE